MTEDPTDRQRTLIANADPAAALATLRRDQVIGLAENAMDGHPAPARRRFGRPAIAWATAAAAAVVVIGAVIVLPLAKSSPQVPTAFAQVPGGTSAKCIAPSAEMLVEYSDTLFRADVTGIADGVVTLDVTEQFFGEPGSVVEVTQGDGLMSDGGPLVFEDGATYLLAANDGVILSCGLSGVASPELEAMYAQAKDVKGAR